MANNISAVFSLKDNFSNGIKGMINSQRNFKKEVILVSSELKKLYDKKRTLQLNNTEAMKAIKSTIKESDKLGDKFHEVLFEKVSKKTEIERQLAAVNKGIKDAEGNMKNFGKTTEKTAVKISTSLKSVGSKLKSAFSGAWGVMKTPLALGGAAAIAGGAYSLNLSGEMEQSESALEQILKNKEAGQKLFKDLKKFAVQTPFEFKDVLDSTRYALAMGFKKDDIMSLMTDVGDAASGIGKGAEGVDNIIRALGQMQAKGKVSAQEINQLAENGIRAWDYIGKSIGKTTAQTMKLAEKGLIPADKAIQAIRRGMKNDFSGTMIKQSKNLLGLLSSVKDFVNLNVFASFGDGLRQGLQPGLIKMVDLFTKNEKGLDTMEEKLKSFGRGIGNFIAKDAEKLYKWFEKLFNNPEFMKADLGGKFKMIMDGGYDTIKKWLDNGGRDKIENVFRKLMTGAMSVTFEVVRAMIPQFLTLGGEVASAMAQGIGDGIAKKVNKPGIIENMGMEEKFALDRGSRIGRPKIMAGITKDEFVKSKDASIVKGYFDRQIRLGFKTKEQLLKENPWAKGVVPGYAYGLSRVPYDGYNVNLHEGEKILTKQEANNYHNLGKLIISKLADTIIVREEADIHKIVRMLVEELNKKRVAFGGVS